MVAVKAKFNHGKIDWEEPPPFGGSFDVMVVFSPTEKPVPVASSTEKRRCIAAMQKRFIENIPRNVSLVDELIAERRLEAARD
jgi:hypothetical protein